jgi:hypothetical protein
VAGVLEAYRATVRSVRLSGPTLFAPIITEAARVGGRRRARGCSAQPRHREAPWGRRRHAHKDNRQLARRALHTTLRPRGLRSRASTCWLLVPPLGRAGGEPAVVPPGVLRAAHHHRRVGGHPAASTPGPQPGAAARRHSPRVHRASLPCAPPPPPSPHLLHTWPPWPQLHHGHEQHAAGRRGCLAAAPVAADRGGGGRRLLSHGAPGRRRRLDTRPQRQAGRARPRPVRAPEPGVQGARGPQGPGEPLRS